jgi:hypothetical protein
MNAKSQVTLFVIIGIVILFSAAIIIYIQTKTHTPDMPAVKKDAVELYVEQCLTQVTEEALASIGMQGGYINVSGADTQLALHDPFRSPMLSTAGGNLFIPYWLYQDTSGFDRSEMPQLEKSYDGDYSIQWQLEDYIGRNVRTCVDNFAVFRPQGIEVIERGTLATDVLIGEDAVSVKLTYPLDVIEQDTTIRKSAFIVDVPVRLGMVYRLAKEIRDYETSSLFLERNTQNLISMYSRIDSSYLPPMYGGLHFEPCSRRVLWMYPDVESSMREVLTANLPFLKIASTDFIPVTVSDSDPERKAIREGVYRNMVHTVSDNYYPYTTVDIGYRQSFPMELDLGDKGLLEPHSFEIDMLFAQLCMLEYQFSYNVKYPVLVTITDEKSKISNKEYVFEFPMVVVLKDNFPRIRYSDLLSESRPAPQRSACDPDQRLSGTVNLAVVDRDKNGIDQAGVTFQCGPSFVYKFAENGSIESVTPFADRCYIGTTAEGVLATPFPQCGGGGLVRVQRDGYLSRNVLIGDTLPGQEKQLTVTLDKIYQKDLTIKKLFVKSPRSGETDGIVLDDAGHVAACPVKDAASPLQSYEQAIVRMTKTDTEYGEMPSPAVAFYSPLNATTIGIAPGTYTVDIMLIRNERFNGELTIRKDSESRSIEGGLSESKSFTYPDKDVLLPTVFSGGASYNWTVSREELESGSSLTLYVFEEGVPKTIEEVSVPLERRAGCSALNFGLIKPKVGS